jgi:predicted RNA binding protein YcfA (HicA-like mRNA interferase family)
LTRFSLRSRVRAAAAKRGYARRLRGRESDSDPRRLSVGQFAALAVESAVYSVKVREAIKALEADGWYLVTIRGDHRQFKHAEKSGKVTIAGALSKDIPPGTLASIFRQAQLPKP